VSKNNLRPPILKSEVKNRTLNLIKMSGWDQNYGDSNAGGGQQQGFYDPAAYNYNYDPGVQVDNYATQDYPAGADQYGQIGGQNHSGDTFGSAKDGEDDFSNEPPLLEELGINPEHIVQKTLAVLNPFRATRVDVAGDADLAGPLVFCLAFGSLLLLSGKIHFNYIYGIGAMGCVANYGLLTLMATAPVSFTVVISVLGYCILPIVALSALSILISLTGPLGTIVTAVAVLWSSLSASKLFVTAYEMEDQQLLVAYPCSMLYAVFALITMF
jgi:hypothetical protein